MLFVNDPLNELKAEFRDTLPSRIAALNAQYHQQDPANWHGDAAWELYRQLHTLTGSAGTFGMSTLSVIARKLENQLKMVVDGGFPPDEAGWAAIGTQLGRLGQVALNQLRSSSPRLAPLETVRVADHERLIHLVEDDPEQGEYLARILRENGYRVTVFTTLDDFRAAFGHSPAPNAIILDMMFPEGDDAGVRLLADIKSSRSYCPPVVFVSVRDDIDARLAAFRAGASRYLLKPVCPSALTDILDSLTGRMPPEPFRVLLVDDDALMLKAQAAVLCRVGMVVRAVSDPRETLESLENFRPDVLVLDIHMPDIQGPELAAIVRERDDFLNLPILFLSAETNVSQQLLALNLGGDDFLVKPVLPEHLVSAVTARARRARQSAAIQRRLQTTLYEREREHLALDYHALVSVADARGDIIEANERFCAVSGYRRDELLGQNHRIVKSGEHPPQFYRDIWRTIARGDVWQGEICNRRKDGSLYWVSSTITPFLDDDGRPYQYVSIRTDISDVKANEALQIAQNDMRSIVGEAAAVLLSADAGTLDAAIEETLGMAGEHLGVDRAYLFLLSDDGLSMSNSHEWYASQISAQKDTLQNMPLASAPWWWDQILQGQPVFVPDVAALPPEAATERALFQSLDIQALCGFPIRRGEQTLGFMGFDQERATRGWDHPAIDLLGLIASLIGSALVRSRSEKVADAAQQRLRRGQMFANIGTWEWNMVTGDLFWTERIAPLFGYPEGNLETSYENFLAAVHPQDRQAVIDAVNACVEQNISYDIEHRVVWPDGTVRWLLERGAVVRDDNGQPISMLGVVQDIDDRKRTELALAEREKELIEAQALASLGNWSADLVTGRLAWSDEVYRIFGYEPGSIVPRIDVFNAAVHPDDLSLVHDSERVAEQTGRHDVVHRIVRPDGSIRHVHELARADVNEQGMLIRLTGTVQDVTDRVEAEQRLRETEERFAFAVEGAGDGVWDWDVGTGEMSLSGNYEPMLGFQPGEMEPTIEAWKSSVHPWDLESVERQLEDYMEGRCDQYSVELRLRCKDRRYKWVLCRGTVVEWDADGLPARLIGIQSDIDQRKAAEQTLQLFKHVVNSVVDGVLVIDTEGCIQLASPAAAIIFGYDQKTLEGNNVSTLMPEPMRSEHDGYLHHYLTTGEGRIINRQIEVMGVKADGSEFPMEVAVSEIEVEQSRYFVGLLRDITERKHAESELIVAREAADRANQAKSDFLSSMSHELRTPMNAILGFGQLMEYDGDLTDEHQDNVKEILKAGEHLLTLINEVLDLSKVESGNLDLSMEPVALSPVLEECLSLVSALAKQRGIQLTVQGLQGIAVRADRTRLKQVVLNLLSNAIKYNRDNGQVSVDTCSVADNRLRLQVSDTGYGIAENRQAELFQPFNRLDAEYSDVEGTGIGLTITRRIVEMMGGSVGVNSKVNVGSTFWIELPLEVEANSADEALAQQTITSDAARADMQTILYIEDNPANLKLVAQILGRVPRIHLLTAHTPSLGIELAMARQPDLILLDINLPGMDGYQVMDVLKADARLQQIPVIAVTANAMPRDIARGKAAGFQGYLTKPLKIDSFYAAIEPLLASQKGIT